MRIVSVTEKRVDGFWGELVKVRAKLFLRLEVNL